MPELAPRTATPSADFVTMSAQAALANERVLGTQVIMTGTLAARPAAGSAGRLYFATDVNGGELQRDTGAAWAAVGVDILHAVAHNAGGADALAIDAVAGTGSLRTLGYGAQKALSGAGLTNVQTLLGADVIVSVTAGVWTDVFSVALTAGTWLVIAAVTINMGGQMTVNCRLWDGTTVHASQQVTTKAAGSATDDEPVTLSVITSPVGNVTERFSFTSAVASSGATAKAAMNANGTGNNASIIQAIRLA